MKVIRAPMTMAQFEEKFPNEQACRFVVAGAIQRKGKVIARVVA